MTRLINFSEGEFYHLYNRGSDKRKIFLSSKDYERFVALLYLCNSNEPVHISLQGKNLNELLNVERDSELVDIGVYCIMPNHFHLLVKEKTEKGISRFMQKLTTAYTMYFNIKNDRNGNLFQGVFKATHVNTDEYLKYLFSYIHLNPIKIIESEWKEKGIMDIKKSKKFLESYLYSSYLDYMGKNREMKKILKIKSFPDYFDTKNSFEKTTEFWLNYKNEFK